METTNSFQSEVEKWWTRLEGLVKGILKNHKEPILITLSRKMPRFIEYYISLTGKNSFLKDVQLTTELAIPFLFTKSNVSDKEFIIVDDMIIHGDTLRTVANDLKYLTGKLCHVSCIFIHEDAIIPDSVDAKDLDNIQRCSQEKIEPYIEEMSVLVEKNQLPIDLEFPIFSSENVLLWDDINNFFKNIEINFSLLKTPTDTNKYIVLFPKSLEKDYSLDFCKIRFYKKNQKIEFEVFSPTILSEENLLQRNISLFENKFYQDLWNETTDILRENILDLSNSIDLMNNITLKKTYARSLCVWANYLLSLSNYIEFLKLINSDIFKSSFLLCSHNLSLIIGNKLSTKIKDKLDYLIQNEETSSILSYKNANIPDSFVPQTFKSKIEVEKGKMLIESKSEEEILQGIFKMQHYTNPIFNRPKYRFERLFFGETYVSLKRAFSPFYSGKEHIERMHLWVDRMIDKGCIIPKYERLEVNGQYIWRRCFHSGLRRI